MAAILMTNITKHIGTAAERAAMSTTGLRAGSLFEETDTGFIYSYDGTTWALSSVPIQAVNITDPADITRQAIFDAIFKTPVGLDVAHHEIHEGDSFHCGAVDLSLASAATLALAFKTPSGTKRVHIIHSFITLTGGHLEILEGPTWTNQTGTKQPIRNRKRLASMTSSGILEDQAQASFVASDNMILGPASLTGGTAIHTHYAFGQKSQFPGEGRETEEWILKPDTQYAFKFTSDAANNKAQFMLNWYEHTDS